MPDGFELAQRLLPPALRQATAALPPGVRGRAEELRLRMGRPASLRLPEGERSLDVQVTAGLLSAVLENATCASLHAVEDELCRGFVSAPGGVRVGVCGTAVTEPGRGVRTLRDVSSLCIRIPRQISGAGASVIPALRDSSVLILSPPGGGKTTFLRELVRTVSDAGVRVSLADERGELAGMYGGVPGFDLGRCTDVLTAAPKAEAAMALLRSMAPEVVAMDEISAPEDAAAIETLLGCGVRIFATAHAIAGEDLLRRPVYARLTERGAFQNLVRISGGQPRRYTVEAL